MVVENEKLQRLFRLLNQNAKPLSADTIRNDIIKSFKEEKSKIQGILQVIFSKYLIKQVNIKDNNTIELLECSRSYFIHTRCVDFS